MSSIQRPIQPGRRVALGLSSYLEEFARLHAAEIWEQFAKPDPAQWRYHFLEIMHEPTTAIFFNLHAIDVWAGVNRAVVGRGGPTDWELLQIMQNESWWLRIAWFDGDEPRPNPFE